MTKGHRLTQAQVLRVFDVTAMTLWAWRKGTPTKTRLRAAGGGRGNAVTYDVDVLMKWAARNGVPVIVQPSDLGPDEGVRPRGPKPRLAAVA